MVVRFSFLHFPVYGENACVLEGRHGGLVGTIALGEERGKSCCSMYVRAYAFAKSVLSFYGYKGR